MECISITDLFFLPAYLFDDQVLSSKSDFSDIGSVANRPTTAFSNEPKIAGPLQKGDSSWITNASL
jgi:hypothetical protein